MARRITKHSTRLSQVHEGALDTPFRTGDRVQTIDGLPGRVLFVVASHAPGVTEYEIVLDGGMGQGTYMASQLRPIPADFRGSTSPVPAGLLPAGITAAIEAEASEIHLASDDYPEMGTVLTDRPDPGQLHRVIGGLSKTAASHSYRGQEDPREEDYNGGAGDTGMYWAEPGQQAWTNENEPQEPAPPPPWAAAMDSPVLARLAQMEEARHFFGTVRQEGVPAHRHATTINGTQVDEHGDAPGHGTVPRASNPDGYDDRSTEGDGDPRWSGQDDPQAKEKNGAAVGMYPEGISAGGGPGLEIGAFTAHMYDQAEGTHATEQHLMAEHGVTPAQLSDMRLRAWHTYAPELTLAHTRVSQGRSLDDWHGDTRLAHGRLMDASELQGHLAHEHGMHLHPGTAPGEMASEHNNEHARYAFQDGEHHGRARDYDEDDAEAPNERGVDDDTAATVHHVPYVERPRSLGELMSHMAEHHGVTYSGDKNPAARFMIGVHDRLHSGETADLRGTEHQHDIPPGYHDPVFGSRHVPWTGQERTELHSWDGAPTAGWGDFVNRTHFTNKTPPDESLPGAVEEMQAEAAVAAWDSPGSDELEEDEGVSQQPFDERHWEGSPGGRPEHAGRPMELAPFDEAYSRWAGEADPGQHASGGRGRFEHTLSFSREAASEDDWARHLHEVHGWDQQNFEHTRARGDRFSDMHQALHDAGMAAHSHAGRPEDQDLRDQRHEDALNGMFGRDVTTQKGKHGFPGESLAWPSNGGASGEDPMIGIIRSAPARPPVHPDVIQERDPARFRRMMSALDPPHPHDDDTSSLDAGPAEGDEEFPEAHDDLDDADAPVPPQAWPMAGAPVNEGGPAYTQGREDGNGGRKFPPPPPPPAPAGVDGENGAPGSGGTNDPDDPDGSGKKIQLEIKAHLGAFVAASRDPRFRFEFTAAWTDVIAKARRIRKEGRVRITHASAGMVIGAVSGDHDVYETGIQRPPHKPQTIQHWACGCPWASFHQDKSLGTRYAGRPCSHVMALQFEAQARTMFGREMSADPGIANHEVVVKSMPPWTPQGWSQTWLAPSASLRTATFMEVSPDIDWLRSHLEHHHGFDTNTIGGPYAADRMEQVHDDEHGDESGVAGRVEHQHDTEEGLPAERHWPAMFEPERTFTVDQRGGTPVEQRYELGDEGRTREFRDRLPFRENSRHNDPIGLRCHYKHGGPCEMRGPDRIAESLHYSRPRTFYSEVEENPHFDPGEQHNSNARATHVLNGYLGPKLAGQIHFSQSDDGKALSVENMHTHAAEGQGVGSAMMDDLYKHALTNRAWINHGVRTAEGNSWWSNYREPFPEINTHHAHPYAGWMKYWSVPDVAGQAEYNHAQSGGRGAHTQPPAYDPDEFPLNDRRDRWTHALGLTPAQRATAALTAAGEDPGEIIALAQLAGLQVTADQANAPWGSSNVAQRPPGKPYGATQPRDPDKSPASYGPLSGPDPENWGGIQEDSIFQAPLTNEASVRPVPGDVHWPEMNGWEPAQENQESFPYSDRSATGGPSTSISPRDPNGIRMEEALGTSSTCVLCGHPENDVLGDVRRETNGADYHAECWAHARSLDHRPERGAEGMAYRDPARWTPHNGPIDPVFGAIRTGERAPRFYAEQQRDHPSEEEHNAYYEGDPDRLAEHLRIDHGYRPEDIAATPGVNVPLHRDAHHWEATQGINPWRDQGGEPRPPEPDDESIPDAGHYHAHEGPIDPVFGARSELRDEPEAALPSTTGEDDIEATATAMGDQSAAEGLTDQAQDPSVMSQQPGMGSMDDPLSPSDPSIQTIGQQQWSGGGSDSDEITAEPGDAQGSMDDIVAAFQRTAGAQLYNGGGPGAGGQASDGDIASAARQFLSKTADVLPDKEAAELIAEGRGQRARNLAMLRLEGTHYEEEDDDLARRGVSLDDYEDDVITV
jgi:hypothetical protein